MELDLVVLAPVLMEGQQPELGHKKVDSCEQGQFCDICKDHAVGYSIVHHLLPEHSMFCTYD